MSSTAAVEQYRYASSFQELQKTLSKNRNDGDLDKSLAYWVLPSDRRLPQAFLGRTLRDVLATPFDELAATPGVGQKKIKAFLRLLSRIAKRQPAAPDPAMIGDGEKRTNGRASRGANGFDPACVSEEAWSEWREAIRNSSAAREPLGRLAPSLQSLPSVIWETPLEWYLDRSLAEIRDLKTHGEKRVRVILEIMHGVHEFVLRMPPKAHLTARLSPAFVARLDGWIQRAAAEPAQVTADGVRHGLFAPIVEQVAIDCGATIARILENRLPMRAMAEPVNKLAKRLGVTRARVYQLLEEGQHALKIRWPTGSCQLKQLTKRLAQQEPWPDGLPLLQCGIEVLYPDAAALAAAAEDRLSG